MNRKNNSTYPKNRKSRISILPDGTSPSKIIPYKSYKEIQIRYNNILNNTFKNIAGFNTRLQQSSKTMRAVYSYLQYIEAGTFLKATLVKQDGLLKEADWSIFEKPMKLEDLEKLLKKASIRYNKIRRSDMYKQPSHNLSMDTFMFNTHTQMSYFIYCSCCPLQKVKSSRDKAILRNIKISLTKLEPKFKELSNKIYNVEEIDRLEPEDQLKYYMNIKAMLEWRIKNKKKLSELNDGWRTLFGTPGLMFQTIGRFTDEFPVKYKPNFLVIDGYNWNDFIYFCLNGWDVDILGKRKRRR